MAIRDIFLPLTSFACASVPAIEKCVTLAKGLGAHLSALAIEADAPALSRPLVRPVHSSQDATPEVPARAGARQMLERFAAIAGAAGVHNDTMIIRSTDDQTPTVLASHARLRDLSLVAVKSHDSAAEKILLALVFSSGRPILILPSDRIEALPGRFDRVTIAWDHSPQASRSAGDAIPLLQAAGSVRIVTVTDQIDGAEAHSAAALVEHLARHGIAANFANVPQRGSSVGKVLEADVRANATDLLVMGAYGHSRLREWTWGGATNTVLSAPPCCVLMSH